MIFKFEELSMSNLVQGAIYKGGDNKTPMKDDPLSKIFKPEDAKKGLGNQGGFRKASKEKAGKVVNGSIAFVVMSDSKKVSEWPNEFDEETGVFTYYGDNRTAGNDIFKTKNLGNQFLYDIFTKSYGTLEDRASIPPVFLFSSTGTGCDKKFIGLAVPSIKATKLENALIRKTFLSEEGDFENFKANFTILDTSQEIISRQWLSDLKFSDSTVSENAPSAWIKFILGELKEGSSQNQNQQLELTEEVYTNAENEVIRNVKVRVTQGKFRDALLERDQKCLVCGLHLKNLLLASHIKPWSKSLPHEKVDPNNGLLLCDMHDALFDKGYITFKDNGHITISDQICVEDYSKLNISSSSSIKIVHELQNKYLNYHRTHIFK